MQLGARAVRRTRVRAAIEFLAARHSRHGRDAKRAAVRLRHPLPARVSDRPQGAMAHPRGARLRDRYHEQLGHDRVPAAVRRGAAVDGPHAVVPGRLAAEAGVERPGRPLPLPADAAGRRAHRQRRKLHRCVDGQPWPTKVVRRKPVQPAVDGAGDGLYGDPAAAAGEHPLARDIWRHQRRRLGHHERPAPFGAFPVSGRLRLRRVRPCGQPAPTGQPAAGHWHRRPVPDVLLPWSAEHRVFSGIPAAAVRQGGGPAVAQAVRVGQGAESGATHRAPDRGGRGHRRTGLAESGTDGRSQ